MEGETVPVKADGCRAIGMLAVLAVISGMVAACGFAPGVGAGKTADRSGGAASYRMRIGHPMAAAHQVGRGYEKFKELVEKRSNGKVTVEIFPSTIIGSDRETHEAMQKGTLEMSSSSTPNMASFTNKFLACDLPYIIENKEEARKVADGPPGDALRAEVEKLGMKILMFSDYGFRQVGAVKKAIKVPEDIKGMKWRTTNSPIEIGLFKALGANPIPIAWGEVLIALEQRAIDGEGNSWSLIYHTKHHEVLRFMAETNYNYSYHVLCINRRYFEGLPKDIQDVLSTSAMEALGWERAESDKIEREAYEAMVRSGVSIHHPNEAEMALWKAPAARIWDDFVVPGKADPEFVDLILKTLGKTREGLFKRKS